MIHIEDRIRSPKEVRSSRTGASHPGGIEENRGRLLELRTEGGTVYVCPSRWERIQLSWTFRHFHVLPPQVLSRHDRRLIKRLSKSALVRPPLPIPSNAVFGVIEQARLKPSSSKGRPVAVKTELTETQAFLTVPETSDAPSPVLTARERLFLEKSSLRHLLTAQIFGPISKRGKQKEEPSGWEVRAAHDARLQQCAALGVLAAVCIVVVLARVNGISLLPSTAQMSNPGIRPAASAKEIATGQPPRLAASPIRVSPPIVPVDIVKKPKHRVELSPPEPRLAGQKISPTLGELESTEASAAAAAIVDQSAKTPKQLAPSPQPGSLFSVEDSPELLDASGQNLNASRSGAAVPKPVAMTSSSTPERLFISELPQGHFVYPVLADPNLVGDLRLRALIGADGSVEDVTVLSGSPKLAEAGMRAVRHWHYNPYQDRALGQPVAVETQIKMSFFGEDAVSITSVANPAPLRAPVTGIPPQQTPLPQQSPNHAPDR